MNPIAEPDPRRNEPAGLTAALGSAAALGCA